MLSEPLGEGLGRAIGEQGHGLAALQIHQDRAIGVPFPQGEIVHPQHGGCGKRRGGLPAQLPQQGILAHGQGPGVAEAHPGRPPKSDAKGGQALGQPQRAPGPGGRHGGQAFGEDTARALAIRAEPLAHAEL